eukprot:SAG22_NODE_13515_length_404_cov_0.534426_1_plen_114_part_01
MEVPSRMSERCLGPLYAELFAAAEDEDEGAGAGAGAEQAALVSDVFGVLLDVLNASLSSATPLADAPTVGRLMLCCKETLVAGECHPFWLGSVGFKLAAPPVRQFSPLQLFRLL